MSPLRIGVVDLESVEATARVELGWFFPGEVKDVSVTLADGAVLDTGLLAGHPEFKGSLSHEYRGVLAEFVGLVTTGAQASADGLAAFEMVESCCRIEEKVGTS
jgi:hypothetical protein